MWRHALTAGWCATGITYVGALIWEAMLEPAEAVVQLLTRQLSQGIARLIDAAKGTGLAARTTEVYLAVTYARIASRQAMALPARSFDHQGSSYAMRSQLQARLSGTRIVECQLKRRRRVKTA